MQFSSKPPFNNDPFPRQSHTWPEPDPAWNRPQHNPTNPALRHFRDLHGRKSAEDQANAAVHWASSLRDMRIAGAYTEAQEDHARRVLSRLANLTKEED